MFLFQISSFQFPCIHTCPCNICIIQIGMNIWEIYSFKRIFIEKLAYAVTNIFHYLFSTVLTWSIQDLCLSSITYWRCFFNITPKNFIEDVLSILLLPTIKAGSFTGMSSLKEFLWNNVNLVLFMLIDNLLALNHWLIFYNPEFTV